jgi:hypothetical protein
MHKSGLLAGGAPKYRCAVRNIAAVGSWQRRYPVAAAIKAALWRTRHPEDYRKSQALYAAKVVRLKAERNA